LFVIPVQIQNLYSPQKYYYFYLESRKQNVNALFNFVSHWFFANGDTDGFVQFSRSTAASLTNINGKKISLNLKMAYLSVKSLYKCVHSLLFGKNR